MALTRRGLGMGLGAALLAPASGIAQDRPAPRRVSAAPASLALLPAPAPPSEILAFDGLLAGPELRIRQGEALRLEVENRLGAPLRLAFPGLAGRGLPAALPPGATSTIELPTASAGTFWFRPLDIGQRARGLAGSLVIEERAAPPVDRDVVVVIKELFADASGAIVDPTQADASRLGLVLTVAGRPEALAIAARPNERLRLRLVNASLGLVLPVAPDSGATLIARDGMPTEPLAANDLRLAPGNRADLVLDAGPPGTARAVTLAFGDRALPIVEVRAEGEPLRPAPLPAPGALPANPVATELNLARARRATLAFAGAEALTVNARASGDRRPVLGARRGETLVFTLDNRTALPLVVHVAGHHLRQLDILDDGWKPWLLDTVLVEAGARLLVACRAELAGSWLIEAHTAAPRPIRAECLFAVA